MIDKTELIGGILFAIVICGIIIVAFT